MPRLAAIVSVLLAGALAVAIVGVTPVAFVVVCALVVGGIALGWKGWADPLLPKTSAGWAGGVGAMFGLCALVYMVECVLGSMAHPELQFLEAGLRTGPFGGFATLAVG